MSYGYHHYFLPLDRAREKWGSLGIVILAVGASASTAYMDKVVQLNKGDMEVITQLSGQRQQLSKSQFWRRRAQ